MIVLKLTAPFAVFRPFAAGWHRPTATFLTPSAAYGLLLNVAAIESRLTEEDEKHPGKVPTTLNRPGLPACRIALGILATAEPPRVQSAFQQLHNYPVGSAAGTDEELAKGRKNNISPVRREFLSDLDAVIALDGNHALEDRIRRGLAGEFNAGRYGLPFLGDNSFLPDELAPLDVVPPVRWYCRVGEQLDERIDMRQATRLTVWIDRAGMAGTISHLYAPTINPSPYPPEEAWTPIEPP
ncbi:MAG: type I-MYXAN CRISPR-associated protein Cas5/Cmx5/DevS [Planctomycetaceae bacterium]